MFVLVLLSSAALFYTFSTGRDATVIGYISYVLSAYTTTVVAVNAPVILAQMRSRIHSSKLMSFLYSNAYGNRYLTDMPYREKITLYASLFANLFYAGVKLLAGLYYASFWFGADALFYIVLSTIQFLMLRHLRKADAGLADEYRQFRFCGYFLFALNAALTGLVYQVVKQGMGYHYPGLMIYAAATYAFSCLMLAVINIFKYRKLNSPVLSAIKAIRLAKALVAIFALQTAMLASFGGNENETFMSLMKALTGGGVCLLIFSMALYMVFHANHQLKNLSINNSLTIP